MSPPEEEAPKLIFPPTKEDLEHLYVQQRLSAAKIAKLYGRETANPRSAAEHVRYYLKKFGIERRHKGEELRKAAEKTQAEWVATYPRTEDPDMVVEEAAVLELVRNKGLSIEYLGPQSKERVRGVMEIRYRPRGVSMTDIADLIGNKTSGYVSWLFRQLEIPAKPFEEARLIGIHDKVRIYERSPFDGTDEAKAYILGLKHGDLYAYRPFGDAVRVSTSTTHPALAELFTQLFSPYGHVSKYPRYKEDTGTYEWNFEAILDESFGFLLESRDKCREWVLRKDSTMVAYLAGLIDAEGNIRPYPNSRTVGITVTIYNTDVDLVGFAEECLRRLGSRPLRPYLDKEGGYVSTKGFRIPIRRDYWRVMVARIDEAQALLRRLPLRHSEKVALKEVALSVARGEPYDKIAARVASLKRTFEEEVDRYTKEAELEYLRTHPGFDSRLERAVRVSQNGEDTKLNGAVQDQSRLTVRTMQMVGGSKLETGRRGQRDVCLPVGSLRA